MTEYTNIYFNPIDKCKNCFHVLKLEKEIRIREDITHPWLNKSHIEKRNVYKCSLNSCILKEV